MRSRGSGPDFTTGPGATRLHCPKESFTSGCTCCCRLNNPPKVKGIGDPTSTEKELKEAKPSASRAPRATLGRAKAQEEAKLASSRSQARRAIARRFI